MKILQIDRLTYDRFIFGFENKEVEEHQKVDKKSFLGYVIFVYPSVTTYYSTNMLVGR